MTKILKKESREFKADPNKIDNFRLFTDASRVRQSIQPENLNFDLRELNPGQFSAPFHFHQFAEELFMVVSGTMILRTNEGMEEVKSGDLIFCEKGKTGAHQFYNHSDQPCVYMDVRTFIGFDLCEYPDSDKIFIAPSYDIFKKSATTDYFDGEKNIMEKWHSLRKHSIESKRKIDR
jgi:uncharacterized cupin superfamily protein